MEKNILLVDDETDICEVMGVSLSDLGYRVYTAGSGEEALRTFEEVRPSVVLTDIRMPGMDGIELLRRIKEEKADTEVIMITGHGDMDLAIKSLKYEATDFITKPVNDDVLQLALERAYERISMRRKLKEYTENLENLVQEIFGLSHTIKTIAGGLEGGTFVLEKGIELDHSEYTRQGWEMIRVSVERIKDLSVGLLNYAKPAVEDYQLCDPNKPMRDCYDLVRPRADRHGVNLRLELTPDLEAFYFDPEGIHRSILNIVTNAIDAVIAEDTAGKRKEVVLKTGGFEGWGVEYEVLDSGTGMEEEIKGKIFRRFFTTKGAMGIGIGLMITRKIIDEHKGVIEFESEKGVGTKFLIRLPNRAKTSPVSC